MKPKLKPNTSKEVIFGDRGNKAVRIGRAAARAYNLAGQLARSDSENERIQSGQRRKLGIAEQDLIYDQGPAMNSRFAKELEGGVELKMHPKAGGTITATGVKELWEDKRGRQGPRTTWNLRVESPRGHVTQFLYATNDPVPRNPDSESSGTSYSVEKSVARRQGKASLAMERVPDVDSRLYPPAEVEFALVDPETGNHHGKGYNTTDLTRLVDSMTHAFDEIITAQATGTLEVTPMASAASGGAPNVVTLAGVA